MPPSCCAACTIPADATTGRLGQAWLQMPSPWYPPAGGILQQPWLVPPQTMPAQRPSTPAQQQQVQQRILNATDILSALNVPEWEKRDFQHIFDQRYQINVKSRQCAEAALSTKEFRNWLTKPKSAELLVQRDESNERADGAEISGLSLVSLTLFQGLLSRERYLHLAFFCGLHTEGNDDHIGWKAMAKNFIAQILRQHTFDLSPLRGMSLEQIRKREVKDLCKLLV
jgi:hypothetical protein